MKSKNFRGRTSDPSQCISKEAENGSPFFNDLFYSGQIRAKRATKILLVFIIGWIGMSTQTKVYAQGCTNLSISATTKAASCRQTVLLPLP